MMELQIKQDYFNLSKYQYTIYDSCNSILFTATANRTILPWLRIITLYNSASKELLRVKQTGILRSILDLIPFSNVFINRCCPYYIFDNNIKKGIITELCYGGTIEISLADHNYQLHLLTGNRISVFLGDKQVGLILRDAWKEGDADKYKVRFDSILDSLLASLFTVIVDIIWFTSDMQFFTSSWENNIQIGKTKGKSDWQPDE